VSFLQLLVSKTMVLSPWQAVSTLYCFWSFASFAVVADSSHLGPCWLAGWLAGLLGCLSLACLSLYSLMIFGECECLVNSVKWLLLQASPPCRCFDLCPDRSVC
jgi:hypothetical protein